MLPAHLPLKDLARLIEDHSRLIEDQSDEFTPLEMLTGVRHRKRHRGHALRVRRRRNRSR